MEGIGAAEIVLVHRQELRDTLISEQPSDRLQLGLAGSGLSAAGLGLVPELLAGSPGCLQAALGLAAVGAHLVRSE